MIGEGLGEGALVERGSCFGTATDEVWREWDGFDGIPDA